MTETVPTTATQQFVTVATSASATTPLALAQLPLRPLGPRDVRVAVRTIGVNPVDWKMRSGGPLRFAHRFVGPKGPLVVGVDFAGEVVEAGAKADLNVGDRVVGGTDFSRKQWGSYADQVVVRDDQCAVLPANVSFDQAACLPVPGCTVLKAFELANLKKAALCRPVSVLVLGASGGVGLMAIQLSRMIGAKAVGVCSTRNVALVERFGAIAVDYTKGDPLVEADQHGPFDLVLHAIGTEVYALPKCREILSAQGAVTLAVIRAQDVPSITFSSQVFSVLGRPHRAALQTLVDAVSRGEIQCLIEQTFQLSEAEKAHEISKLGKVVGKLLLHP